MNEKLFEEDLSVSYLRAIAAKAHVTFELNHRDEDSKDVDLKKEVVTKEGNPFSVEFSVQLKATSSKNCYSENESIIKYSLKGKNYNDLCKSGSTSIILCLLILPEDKTDWVNQTEHELILKKAMYWANFYGGEKTNQDSITITIDKNNLMTAETLNELIQKIADNGGRL